MADRASPPVTGTTRVAGVIGSPVRHSLSPTLLNAAFRPRASTGSTWRSRCPRAPELRPWPRHAHPGPPGAVGHDAAQVGGLGGGRRADPHRRALGAVNCVFERDGRLVGDNTDGPGFVDSLVRDEGVALAGRRCVLLARAEPVGPSPGPWARQTWPRWWSSTGRPTRPRRAAELAGRVGRVGEVGDVAAADVVVNATSLGMAGGAAAGATPVDPDLLRAGQVVVDLGYHPAETPLLAAARARGAVAVNGVGMLVHQAAHAFARWTGEPPPLREMTHRDPARARTSRAVCRQFVTQLKSTQRGVRHPPPRVVVGLTLGAGWSAA